MESSRLFLAMALCFIVVLAHSYYSNLLNPVEKPVEGDPAVTPPGVVEPGSMTPGAGEVRSPGGNTERTPDPTPPVDERPQYPAKTVTMENPVLRVTYSTRGASITEAILTQYVDDDGEQPLRLIHPDLESGYAFTMKLTGTGAYDLSDVDWEFVKEDESAVVFRYPLPQGQGDVVKTFTLSPDTYTVTLGIQWPQGIVIPILDDLRYELAGPERIRHDQIQMSPPNYRVMAYPGPDGTLSSVDRRAVGALDGGENWDPNAVLWGGLESNFFVCVTRPLDPPRDLNAYPWRLHEIEGLPTPGVDYHKMGLQAFPFVVGFQRAPEPGQAHDFELFLGPKEKSVLERFEAVGYEEFIDYGFFSPFIRFFLFLFGWITKIVPSYGVAIIILTVIVKVTLHPLNRRNQATMQRNQKKMAKIQPQMKELKERYKNDGMKANREIQKLMKESNVNPAQMFGGCLMMFLQLPIWIGLYRTFSLAIELRQQPFLYVADLTRPDALFSFGFELPLLAWSTFNLLPVIYVILTLVNQRMMPRSDDPQMQQQQKMMSFMMVAFGFIFYNFSSGLMLYFLTNSGLGILEQRIIKAELKREGLG